MGKYALSPTFVLSGNEIQYSLYKIKYNTTQQVVYSLVPVTFCPLAIFLHPTATTTRITSSCQREQQENRNRVDHIYLAHSVKTRLALGSSYYSLIG